MDASGSIDPTMAELRVKGGGEVPIAAGDVVAVGVVDIAGAGARAVLGMRAPGTAALELELTGVGKPSGSGEDGDGPTFGDDIPPLCLVQPAPGVSLVAVNRPLTVAEEAPFAHALASLVASRGCETCIVAGALRLNVRGEGNVFQHAINGAALLELGTTESGDLPGNLTIADGTIAACVHALRYSGVPTVCAFTHGYRVAKLVSDAASDAGEVADRLGEALAKGLGCVYNGCAGLNANYVWQPDEVSGKTDQMYN